MRKMIQEQKTILPDIITMRIGFPAKLNRAVDTEVAVKEGRC